MNAVVTQLRKAREAPVREALVREAKVKKAIAREALVREAEEVTRKGRM